MSEKSKVRFIRKGGRVIPIRAKETSAQRRAYEKKQKKRVMKGLGGLGVAGVGIWQGHGAQAQVDHLDKYAAKAKKTHSLTRKIYRNARIKSALGLAVGAGGLGYSLLQQIGIHSSEMRRREKYGKR